MKTKQRFNWQEWDDHWQKWDDKQYLLMPSEATRFHTMVDNGHSPAKMFEAITGKQVNTHRINLRLVQEFVIERE